MLKLQNNTIQTKDDAKLLSDEQRAARAVSEYLLACNDKKNVLKEIESLDKELETKNTFAVNLQRNIKTLEESVPSIEKTIKGLESEVKTLEKSIESSKKTLVEQHNAIKIAKDQYAERIDELAQKYSAKEITLSNAITELEKKQKGLLIEVNDLQSDKNALIVSSQAAKESLSVCKDEENVIKGNYKAIQNLIESSLQEIQALEDKTLQISEKNQHLEKIKDSFELEVEVLEKVLVKKKELVREEELKAFALINKQTLLEQKTALIKKQYERAGIKWDE